MSYILDALKRAEASRGNTGAPDQPQAGSRMVFAARPRPSAPRPWFWLIAGLLAALAAGWAWRSVVQPAEKVATVPPAAPLAVAAPPPAAPPPVAVAPLVAAAQAAATPPVALPPPPAPPAPRVIPAPVSKPAAKAKPATKSAPAPAPAPATAEPEQRILSREDLPPELQRELPPLKVSGSTWSDNPAHRMLIVNGVLVNENGEILPGLAVEKIRQQSAVLRFKGYRFLLKF